MNIMPINTYMNHIAMMIGNNFFLCIIVAAFLGGCSLSPGMYFETDTSWLDKSESIYIESIQKRIEIKEIGSSSVNQSLTDEYLIGVGDQISITVWGLPDIFPIINAGPDSNLRRVDSKGYLFFPYVGVVNAVGKTQNELRIDITDKLSNYFNEPQLDLSVARFNSQRIYMLGEVLRPGKLNLTDIPTSLTDAIGEVDGINPNTADGSEVIIIRQASKDQDSIIYKADLSSPAGFLAAGDFYLTEHDIVFVNAQGI